MRSWMVTVLVRLLTAGACVTAGACAPGEREAEKGSVAQRGRTPEPATAAAAPVLPLTAGDSVRERARVALLADSLRAAFARATVLEPREVAELRQDRNAEQVATARSLGQRVSGQADMDALLQQGQLVPLGDSTAHWVLREMEHSVPYVTPDARTMLEQLVGRFHQRLARLGLPAYRVKVTSALRTDETQADLRKTNTYAARSVSAHEFGTTIDVSHERFAVPAPPRAGAGAAHPDAWSMEAEVLEELGEEHARVLQAELGRAIAEMRDRGELHVMMENRQPVYHMTVARRFSEGGREPL